jgi:hypothetical protein
MRSATAESSLPVNCLFGIQLVSETNHGQLFFGIESLDFFDDLTRGHIARYGDALQSSTAGWKATRIRSAEH